jgi:hypothetical protein
MITALTDVLDSGHSVLRLSMFENLIQPRILTTGHLKAHRGTRVTRRHPPGLGSLDQLGRNGIPHQLYPQSPSIPSINRRQC